MALSSSEKAELVTAALKEHIPYDGSGSDSRTLADLKTAFLDRHLGALVRQYQEVQANVAIENIDVSTVS